MHHAPSIVAPQNPVAAIIERAGGAPVIAEKSKTEEESCGELSAAAVYKWQQIGIPDRHWPLIIKLADTTPTELYEANKAVRGVNA
jgi:hypothetical protein